MLRNIGLYRAARALRGRAIMVRGFDPDLQPHYLDDAKPDLFGVGGRFGGDTSYIPWTEVQDIRGGVEISLLLRENLARYKRIMRHRMGGKGVDESQKAVEEEDREAKAEREREERRKAKVDPARVVVNLPPVERLRSPDPAVEVPEDVPLHHRGGIVRGVDRMPTMFRQGDYAVPGPVRSPDEGTGRFEGVIRTEGAGRKVSDAGLPPEPSENPDRTEGE